MESNSQSVRWPAALWAAAIIGALGMGWLVAAATKTPAVSGLIDEPANVAPGTAIGIPGPADPLLLDGRLVSREHAEAIAGYPVVVPSDPLASQESLEEIWVAGDTREVALRFSTGVRIYLAKWPTGKDARESLTRQAKEAGAGRVDDTIGIPVWILPMNGQDQGHPPQANVTTVIDGVEVNIWGNVGTDVLLRIASSMMKSA